MTNAPDPSDSPDGPPAPRASLDDRWWWSPVLRVVVGAGVIAYQTVAFDSPEGGTWLNWGMVVVGAGVAVWGLVALWQAWQVERASHSAPPSAPEGGPPSQG